MPAGATLEGLPRERYPVSKTGGSSDLEGSTPSPSSLETWPSGKAAPCYGVGRFAASQVRVLLSPLFRRGRVGTTRDCYSRGAGSSPAAGASVQQAPVVETG